MAARVRDGFRARQRFIMRRPELLHKRPEKASSSASRAWPSRRSVHYVATALASARIHGLSEIDTDDFMAAFVGLPWVQEFATWRANMDLPDPADVLDGNSNWKHDGRRLDRTMAVLSSCAALVVPEKAAKKKERGNKLWEMIGSVLKDAADVATRRLARSHRPRCTSRRSTRRTSRSATGSTLCSCRPVSRSRSKSRHET